MLAFLAVFVTIGLAHGAGLNVSRCSGGHPATSSVQISGCSELPCFLIRGTDVSGRVEFQTPFATRTLRPRVRFTVGSASGEYPLPEVFQNACNHLLFSQCPLSATEDVTWQLTMPVLEEYPPETSLILEVSLIGDLDRVVTCFEVPTVVV